MRLSSHLGQISDCFGILFQVLEEMPPSSPSPTQQTDLQLGMKKPNRLPQRLSRSHTEM